jgi:Rrf2 family protein
MHLSRSADYAIRAIFCLAGLPEGTAASGSALAMATGVGEPFLQKVLRLLVRSRLVRAQPGVGGGFRLNIPAEQISMLRVIEAVDGPLESGTCLVEDQHCERKPWCSVHLVLNELHRHSLKVLSGTSIERLRRDAETRREFLDTIKQRRA